MRFMIKIIVGTILILTTFFLHYTVLNTLPKPFDNLNIIFGIMVLLTVFVPKKEMLWLVLPLAFLVETYSSAPFGFISFAFIISLSVVHWLLRHTFTNRSIPIVFLAAIIGLSIYRLTFFILLAVGSFFRHQTFSLSFFEILSNFGYELLFTISATLLLYIPISVIVRKLLPRHFLVFEEKIMTYEQKRFF